MRDRAKEFGSRIQREDGIAEAVRLLQYYLQRGVTESPIRGELNVPAAENSACHP